MDEISPQPTVHSPQYQADRTYTDSNQDFLAVFFIQRENKGPALLRVPTQQLDNLSEKEIQDWIGTLNKAPGVHIELYDIASPDRTLPKSAYSDYRLDYLLDKPFTAQRTKKNTVTLLYSDKEKDLAFTIQTSKSIKDSIPVPVLDKGDPYGLIRGTLFGFRLIHIANNTEDSEFIKETLNQYNTLLNSHNIESNLTVDDIRDLATSSNINTLVGVLRKILDAIPIVPEATPDEIRDMYEHAKEVLEAA
jgi:hypothetical protein